MAEFASELKFQIEYQEAIMQNVRSTHLIFQALFIAICVAILIFVCTFVVSAELRSEDKEYIFPECFQLFSYLLVAFFNYVVVEHGSKLNKDYAKTIEKRGRVIDFVHHMALLCSESRIEALCGRYNLRFVASSVEFDITAKIKVLERILENSNQDYASFLSDNKSKDSLRVCEDEYYFLKYIGFYCDIYKTSYIDEKEFNIIMNGGRGEFKVRKVSDARKGHVDVFSDIWTALRGATLFIAGMICFVAYETII